MATLYTANMRAHHSKQPSWQSLAFILVWVPLLLTTGVSGQVERDVVSPGVNDDTTTAARAEDTNGSTVLVSGNDTMDANAVQYVQFNVQLDADTTDSFVVEVHPSWAPLGAARFLELVDADFFNEVRFFRVIDSFVAQFGISGDPVVAAQYNTALLEDDPVVASNTVGTFSFAMAGPGTRTSQIFVNLQDNEFLDDSGFAPFAQVASPEDQLVVEQLYNGYGEGAPQGNGPSQQLITAQGNEYLEAEFPLLSYIISAERMEAPNGVADAQGGQEPMISDGSTTVDGTTDNGSDATDSTATDGDLATTTTPLIDSTTDSTNVVVEPTSTATPPVDSNTDTNSATDSSAEKLLLKGKLLLALSLAVAAVIL